MAKIDESIDTRNEWGYYMKAGRWGGLLCNENGMDGYLQESKASTNMSTGIDRYENPRKARGYYAYRK